MTRVVVVGERGDVTQTVTVGPAVLIRSQTWDDLSRLTEIVSAAGLEAVALDPRSSAREVAELDCWILSDLPFAAAAASGLYARLVDPAAAAGVLMLGGAMSFAGQHGVAGWSGAESERLWPVIVGTADDAIEAPDGLRLRATADCPYRLAAVLQSAPPVFGYNAVRARPEAAVIAEFEGIGPAIVTMERDGRSRAVFASDLMPHWGAAMAAWDGLPSLVNGLVRLVVRS